MASCLLLLLLSVVGAKSDCMIVQFTSDACVPCQQLQPSLNQLKADGWIVRTVDTEREPLLVRRFQIQSLPTLVIVENGQEVDRIVGAAPYEAIIARLQKITALETTAPAVTAPALLASQVSNSSQAAVNVQSAPSAPSSSSMTVRGQSPSLGQFPLLAAAATVTGITAAPMAMPASFNQPVAATRVPHVLTDDTESQIDIQHAIARADAATVRIRVDESNTTAFGTGTIVDVHGDEALVLTCGHLFRDMTPGSQLTVDLFAGKLNEVNVPAILIDWTANPGAEDIGLLSFRLPVQIAPVPLLPRGHAVAIGQPAFSFGCDHGQDPTRRDTQVKSINRYIGSANIEIAGAPAVGRSGGGLFDVQGRLVGVCNAADAEDDEGIYAAADVVYSQIERLGLNHLFEHRPSSAGTPTQLVSNAQSINSVQTTNEPQQRAEPTRWPDQSAQVAGNAASNSEAAARQVICIVRQADGRDQVITVMQPSPQLLQAILTQGTPSLR